MAFVQLGRGEYAQTSLLTHTHMTFLEGLMGADGLHLWGYRGEQEASIFNQANVLWDVLPTCKIDN